MASTTKAGHPARSADDQRDQTVRARPREPGNTRPACARRGGRAELVAIALQLRATRKLTTPEIAVRLDRAPATVERYLSDPTGAKLAARKRRLAGVCVDCGAPTSGRAGGGTPAHRCRRCRATSRLQWTPPLVVEALRAWQARYGLVPSSYDLSATHSRQRGGEALARWNAGFRDGLPWPSASIVTSRFGSFQAGIAVSVLAVCKVRDCAGVLPGGVNVVTAPRAEAERAGSEAYARPPGGARST
jgi:hypothetical protein